MMRTRIRIITNIVVSFIFIVFLFSFYSTFSINTEYSFGSVVYDIDDNYIRGISSNTSVELYSKYFDMDNCSIEVVGLDNKEISGYVFNGSKTILRDANGNAIGSYINVVKGDYNGNGAIDKKDYYEMGKCLVRNCLVDEDLMLSVDMDGDKEFHINDLVMLDKAVSGGYTGISLDEDLMVLQSGEQDRLVAKVMPSYGVNQNVRWSSDDTSVVIVDDAGRVIGRKEGEARVRATTLDGKYSADALVRVDNTIQLSSYEGVGYIGGNDIVVDIKAVDYDDISCNLGNSNVASCRIEDRKLILSPINTGSASVVVSSSKYGEVSYSFKVLSVYLNVMPQYVCGNPNGAVAITVSGFNSGEMTFYPEDSEIVKSAYMETIQNRRMLRINYGSKAGRTNLLVKEGNGNSSALVIVDVTYMSLSHVGVITKVGEEVRVSATGGNLGKITCKSNDISKGTCRVEGNDIIVTPLKSGSVNIDVYNNHSYEDYHRECGQQQFVVVIQEG